jgi:hypothetical protein
LYTIHWGCCNHGVHGVHVMAATLLLSAARGCSAAHAQGASLITNVSSITVDV